MNRRLNISYIPFCNHDYMLIYQNFIPRAYLIRLFSDAQIAWGSTNWFCTSITVVPRQILKIVGYNKTTACIVMFVQVVLNHPRHW